MAADHVALVVESAARLSDMANNVAGFAISSSLVLIFACLKDITKWVKTRASYFHAGVIAGCCVYVACVWYLHGEEIKALDHAGALDATLKHVSDVLVWSRTAGIIFFSLISMLAVWGSRRG